MKDKKLPAFEIALSAMACAFATVFLSVGMLNPYLLATGYILSCFALMLPLSKGFILGDILAYLATIGLSFLFGASASPWRLMPFILIFGLHPLANHLQLRFHWNEIATLVLKTLWFDGALYLIWRFLFDMTTSFPIVDEYIVPVILVAGSLFFVIYDRLIFRCQAVVDRLVARIKK
jgi:hypothetical protein